MVFVASSLNAASNYIQDQLNSFLGVSSQVDSNGMPRNAMIFTSTLRQSINKQSAAVANLGGTSPAPGAAPSFTSDFSDQVFAQSFFKNARTVQPSVAMAVNPKSVHFKQPKRFSEKKTMNGSVFYHFTNSKGQNNDILRIEFRGNTGNIDRRGSIDPNTEPGDTPKNDTGAIAKLIAWHNLYLLSHEPILLNNGQENEFRISYISPIFPVVIDFIGFFAEALEFEENAEKPHSLDYTMNFIVTRTDPDLDEILDDIQSVLSAIQAIPNTAANLLGTTNTGSGIAVPVPASATLVNM